jgi:hypothetical protein
MRRERINSYICSALAFFCFAAAAARARSSLDERRAAAAPCFLCFARARLSIGKLLKKRHVSRLVAIASVDSARVKGPSGPREGGARKKKEAEEKKSRSDRSPFGFARAARPESPPEKPLSRAGSYTASILARLGGSGAGRVAARARRVGQGGSENFNPQSAAPL